MTEHRLYRDLADWWPLISDPAEYAEEAAEAARHLGSAAVPAHDVLELGSGGGNNAVHLRRHFTMTLVDLSADMLAVSRRLNPDCEHHVGDMREVRLGRTFDAVFVHDAVDYMLTEDDLRAAMVTAFEHCRPGGLALFIPDETTESFVPDTDHGGHDSDDGRAVRWLEWSWDPDPGDTSVTTLYVFVLRHADGRVETVEDSHRLGLFGRADWVRLLGDVGFDPEVVIEVTTEDRRPRDLFIGRRPSAFEVGDDAVGQGGGVAQGV